MKFRVGKSSDWNYNGLVTIRSLRGLLKFVRENGGKVIISFEDDPSWELEIYDGWRE